MANSGPVRFSSGAISTPAYRFDLVPAVLLEKVAKRFEEGAEKYGEQNWRAGLNDPEYLRDRANHALQHLIDYIHGIGGRGEAPISPVENLAAVGWAVAVLLEAERLRKP